MALLIVDELGFVPFERTGGELIFNLLADRYERRSTIVTTNLIWMPLCQAPSPGFPGGRLRSGGGRAKMTTPSRGRRDEQESSDVLSL